jgi:hypothetical protein
LINGNRAKHNRMVIEAIRRLSKSVDVIVCAQGSMVAILPELGTPSVPVLTSMRLGVQAAAKRVKILTANPVLKAKRVSALA